MPSDDHGAFCTHETVHVAGAPEGPLAGLRFAAKDLFDVAGHVTGAGNPDWLATHPPAEASAPAVQALLDAGATLVGKTHTDELAFSLNGENAHYGTPRNPHGIGRLPGGSSSGSAVAVAAELVDFALGSDTGGSVRLPASYCGVYGIRPSHGRIPLTGVVPLAPSFDTVGWFARSPALLQRVGQVLLGAGEPPPPVTRLLLAADAFELLERGPRRLLQDAAQHAAERLGLTLEATTLSPEGLPAWRDTFRRLQGRDIWGAHGEWIQATQPRFGPGVRERFEMAASLAAMDASEDEALRATVRQRLTALLPAGTLMLLPAAAGPAPRVALPQAELAPIRDAILALTSPAGLAGAPQVTLPLARKGGLPIGLGLLGAPGADATLLATANAFPDAAPPEGPA